MMRFEARCRRGEDDGDDFRDFVGEVLSIGGEYGSPARRDSGSSDGCIDLFAGISGVVVECKHIRADRSTSRKRVAQEWKEIRDKLDRALLSVDGIAAPSRAPYRPWADAERPIRQYVFATSADLANLDHRKELTDLIQSFFRNDIGLRAGYEHLRDVHVDVLDWSDFETRLRRREFKALVFRWLEQWPPGFAQLDAEPTAGFRAFLGERLPYLARDTWAPPPGLVHAWTENSLVQALVRESSEVNSVVVLTGPGGIGKTRLGLELARQIHREHGWWAIRCDGRNASSEGLRKLLAQSPEAQRIILFADYLETWPGFEAFVNDIANLNETSGHVIRLIGTCRASYRERLPPSIRKIAVGAPTRLEDTYYRAVCEHILHEVDSADGAELAQKCRHNAALAAFLLLLYRDASGNFKREISSLRESADFTEWVLRRLRNAGLSLGPVATILAACPLQVDAFDGLAAAAGGDSAQLADVLVADHWIERQEPVAGSATPPVWAAFHDVFADSVLACYLYNAPDLRDGIDRLMERGMAHGAFGQVLTSLERLKDSPAIAGADWISRFQEAERRKPGTLAAHAREVVTNALLSPADRLALIVAHPQLREAIAQDRDCDVGLALSALALAIVDLDEPVAMTLDAVLLPLLDRAVRRPAAPSNLVLRLAFLARPERYRNDVLTSCANYPLSLQTHFLLKVWLEDVLVRFAAKDALALGHLDEMRNAVDAWLRSSAQRSQASFVLSAWLDVAAAVKGDRAIAMVSWYSPMLRPGWRLRDT